MVTATQSLSDEMIELFAAEIGAEVRLVDPGEEQEVELHKLLEYEEWDEEEEEDPDAVTRAPVVTVMGHVDHGKTLLLDKIRESNVIEGEAGGITQAIGAYKVVRDGHEITFIDTPGHEAFTAMRARGADATDIVILVVAADDGVMPQTVEALNHAKAADVPIIVALNKVDRENADVQRVMGQLTEHELIPESYGGDTIVVETSALQDLGVDDLLEQVLLVAELEELRANPEGRASGVVLESHLDTGRGPVATVLVQRGTLSVGDPVVAGAAAGKVRALIDDHGDQIKTAGPSTPVELLGLSDVAAAGTSFIVAPDEKVARTVSDKREHFARQASMGRDAGVTGGAKLEDIFSQIQAGEAATLNLVIKADTNGSMEAVTDALRKLERDEVKLAFVHRGVGGITENDINLAAAANATILGFNVRPERKARQLAEQEGVEIRTYEVIYALLEDIESAMVGHARARVRGDRHRRGRGPRDLPGPQDRRHRGLLRPQRDHHPGLEGPLPAGGHGALEGHHHLAAPVQGRRPRGPVRLRVRHRPLGLPEPAAGRHHRDRRGARDPARLTGARPRDGDRPPSPGLPVAQGQAGGAPADRGGPAQPVPGLGRRGGRPGPLAAGQHRCRRRRRHDEPRRGRDGRDRALGLGPTRYRGAVHGPHLDGGLTR